MLKSYFMIAFRQLSKNKLYATINTLGLVVGLSVYVFGSILVSYERNYDRHWANADRIYTVRTLFGPEANIGINENDGTYSGFAPFIESDINELEAVARTLSRKFLVSVEDDHYYQYVRFFDPALLQILDFEYQHGDSSVFNDPSSVMLSAATAEKYFGSQNPVGKTITLDHKVSLRVAGVLADLPANNHLTSSLIGETEFSVIAPIKALNAATDYDLKGNFNNLSSGELTYVLAPPGKNIEWLQANIDGVFDRHFPGEDRDFISGIKVRPLSDANTYIWDAIGLPILDSVALMAFLVLVVAIVNYTNLATAQSLGRNREIGLRKTLGASRRQLVSQFLIESLSIAALAMLFSIAVLELVIPLFNRSLNRELILNYVDILPWLTVTTIGVGLVAGAYTAYLITRTTPIEALSNSGKRGAKGGRFRSAMLIVQFSISVFMLAMVLIVYLQNRKIEQASEIYPKSEILTLQRLDIEAISKRRETLTSEIRALPNVAKVTFSSLLPYQQSNSSFTVGPVAGDEDQSFLLNQVLIDEHFLDTYNIPLIVGRTLRPDIANDTLKKGVLSLNVVVNELAARKLGFQSSEQAIGKLFYDFSETRDDREYTIVGVVPDQNFQGFHNQIKPTAFMKSTVGLRHASVRVNDGNMAAALTAVTGVWDKLVTDYPIQPEYLEDEFNETFEIYQGMSFVLGGFAFLALSLSMIGLFGLAAFLAATRTKEIGVRKVMGANTLQIVRLLVWQFSKPVMWAMLVALPLAYAASNYFLQFFAERINYTEVIVLGAGLGALLFAWLVVGIHAMRIARANPIQALRHE